MFTKRKLKYRIGTVRITVVANDKIGLEQYCAVPHPLVAWEWQEGGP